MGFDGKCTIHKRTPRNNLFHRVAHPNPSRYQLNLLFKALFVSSTFFEIINWNYSKTYVCFLKQFMLGLDFTFQIILVITILKNGQNICLFQSFQKFFYNKILFSYNKITFQISFLSQTHYFNFKSINFKYFI